MTPEEIAVSDDVDELYTQLKAARVFDDHVSVRLIEARMRQLAGANTKAAGRGKRVAVDEAQAGRVRNRANLGGAGHA